MIYLNTRKTDDNRTIHIAITSDQTRYMVFDNEFNFKCRTTNLAQAIFVFFEQ